MPNVLILNSVNMQTEYRPKWDLERLCSKLNFFPERHESEGISSHSLTSDFGNSLRISLL